MMKNKLKEKLYSRKLDDQGKVFALVSNKKYSSVFRLSVNLKENVNEELLQQAVGLALEKFKAFKVKMKKGVFWNYFVENEMMPIVTPERNTSFKKVNTRANNKYLFRVTYLKNKINIEFFHALTDGNGGAQFFKEIIYRYLELMYPNKLEFTKLDENEIVYDTENAYVRNYQKNVRKKYRTKIAHRIKGKELEDGKIGVSHFNINLPQVKQYIKLQQCSVSMYLIAMIAYAIYEGEYKINKGKRPINLCIPISLQKYFRSETISNFFSYMVLTLKPKKYRDYTFEDFLDIVKKEFEKKLKLERIIETMSNETAMTHNPIVRAVPLAIKKFAVKVGSLKVKRHFTMTISNIGKFEVKNKYSEFVDNACVILAPDWAEKMKCGICSYGDNLVVSFGTYLKDNMIEKRFKEILEKNNINYKFENSLNYLSC